VDGEEITNEIPGIQGGLAANPQDHQMWLIHRDFKHFAVTKAIDFLQSRKESSIMRAKVLSIMRAEAQAVRSD
jgi:hypothetical protein